VERYIRPAVAELVGTFVFFFIGAGAIVTTQYIGITSTAGAAAAGISLVLVALAHGFILSIMVSVFGATSGGHFNPAVTLGFLVTRRISAMLAAIYIVAQLVGGTLSGLALRAIFTEKYWGPVHLGTPSLGPGISFGTGVLVEALLTGFLLLAVFGTAVDARAPKIGGFAIGLTVMVDILLGGPLTGAAMNPAREFGPALASGYWTNWEVYWIGPIIGGCIAALLYEHVILGTPVSEPET
jgi:MIP family channel proteins